ncbi:hypothetical protein PIB30_086326 [Stylosanthes scabra]|uniref:Uncharacterized protein n=1 Tax=Stylosanthes scabra TaxID=79078 RepID=A0ABU6VS89_9FABA|nr:hypothetical protein [Stylosanthes scabra]
MGCFITWQLELKKFGIVRPKLTLNSYLNETNEQKRKNGQRSLENIKTENLATKPHAQAPILTPRRGGQQSWKSTPRRDSTNLGARQAIGEALIKQSTRNKALRALLPTTQVCPKLSLPHSHLGVSIKVQSHRNNNPDDTVRQVIGTITRTTLSHKSSEPST